MAFRLARLLRLYEQEEKQRLNDLRLVRQRHIEAVRYVSELEAALAAVEPGNATRGEGLQRNWAYRRATMQLLESARSDLAVIESELAKAQAQLMAARQQVRTVQALQEKYEARIQAEEMQREQIQLDEVGLRLHLAARHD